MKKKMYEYASVILVPGGLILWFITFFIDRWYNYNHVLVWMPFLIIYIISSMFCGIMIKKLYQQAHTDMLTGLCSRRYFYKKLSGMKAKSPVSLVLIDIDNFKSINDTYGHRIGDQVLRQFADILQNITRRNDIIARWGGEEFAVILFQTEDKEAFKIADRIRREVQEHIFSYKEITFNITVSIGIASTKAGANIDIEQFFKIADKALYKAKEKKNYVMVAEG
ncbi:MAG: GGDEF domain-containing protein [Firmicutes bacterium]|nr:GGDEF domain-containing protein [Bacillota bacterium]